MAKWVLEIGVSLALLYSLFPALLSRIAGVGVLRSVPSEGAMALTFDDGPHPVYTPKLLDLLQEHGVKATFFLVGTQAEKHPELVRRMHREGHTIGIHGYRHTLHWMKMPWTVSRDAERTAGIIEGLTGARPRLFRPPWGLLNLLDYLVLRKYRIVLWSCIPGDWRKQHPDRLWRRLSRHIRPGAVIVLHDSDLTPGAEQGAPLVMLKSLRRLLQESSQQSLHWARVDEDGDDEEESRSAVVAGRRADLPTFVSRSDSGFPG
jgi:peptidoglycan/xylan/chitin deacetylase (PgdA/CDA1 family)